MPPGDNAAALERFRTLLRIPTVSRRDERDNDWLEFERFISTVADLYPLTHAALTLERVAGHSLLYRWQGRHRADAAAVLMAHYDVVAATDAGWRHPPFAAALVDNDTLLWGRGAIDNKGSLVAILEAVEALVSEGFQPDRDVYLFFGHNEETAGAGAVEAVEVLSGRGIRASIVLDEGGAVVEGIFPGVAEPAAVVGVSEKGIATIDLVVEQQGGHASTPPTMTATTRLARAIVRLSRKPVRARLSAPTEEMIATLGAHARGPAKLLFVRPRLTGPVLLALFSRLSDETRAMVRSTIAVTELSGSIGANVLAETARATINARVAVGSSTAEVVEHVRRAIRDDSVSIIVRDSSEPSPVSPTTGEAWQLLSDAISATFSGVIVTPYVQLGASDSRRFTAMSDNVYRFTPFELSKRQRDALHAIDEHISVEAWVRGIRFYESFVRSL